MADAPSPLPPRPAALPPRRNRSSSRAGPPPRKALPPKFLCPQETLRSKPPLSGGLLRSVSCGQRNFGGRAFRGGGPARLLLRLRRGGNAAGRGGNGDGASAIRKIRHQRDLGVDVDLGGAAALAEVG